MTAPALVYLCPALVSRRVAGQGSTRAQRWTGAPQTSGAVGGTCLTARMRLISVDLQHDFASPGGTHHRGQPCVAFVTGTVVPFAREHSLVVAEIVSDYRSSGGNDADTTCVPGQWGFESVIPADLKPAEPWVKASIAPTWVRDGGGRSDAVPGPARPDPSGFATWLDTAIGPPDSSGPVVIMGLVLEVCVLATLIDIRLRGYSAAVLVEGVDTSDGDQQRKREFLDTLAGFWGQPMTWPDLLRSVEAGESIATC
jgi:nicotinamidase-related amidase